MFAAAAAAVVVWTLARRYLLPALAPRNSLRGGTDRSIDRSIYLSFEELQRHFGSTMTLIGRLRGNFSLRIRSPRPNSNSSIRTKHTGSLSTSGGGSLAVIPEVELDSASTSDIVSFEGDDAFSTDALRSLDPNDPYADVRYDLDRLFYNNDRKLHSSSSASSTASGGEDDEAEPPVPWFIAYTCYLGYMVFFVVGNLRDVCALLFGGRFRPPKARYPSEDPTRYATLLMSWEHFFACRIYCRLQDCFNRPIASNPGTTIQVLERLSRDGQKSMEVVCRRSSTASDDGDSYQRNPHCTATPDGTLWRECLNLGSYNYLGFADDWQDTCAIDVRNALTTYPISMSASLGDCGRTHLHRRVEAQIATFLGKDDALCLNMGFNTNATVLPALVGKGDLVVSDALNHNSLVNGARASGAAVRVFRHNDTTQLEAILREAILLGRPRLRRPWNKILVVVEGIYSMEGEYCDLKNIVRLCKQYGAYVYLDEAHSIGATGPTGRGCAEHAGVDPADIDVMMGTFTKSFGALGGYIAASKETIAFLRRRCSASVHHNSMSPIVCQQVLSALQVRPFTKSSKRVLDSDT